jgi:uncharacterized UBP type Zn finger protein
MWAHSCHDQGHLAEGCIFLLSMVVGVAANVYSQMQEEPMPEECTHLNQIKIRETDKHVCEECAKTGDTWVHLRLCLVCGHVGCCDSSKNKHATKHFHKTQHPLIRSIEPGESWVWCYVDEIEPGELVA